MLTTKLPAALTGLDVAKRMMFLAYEASIVVGMGTLQAVKNANEQHIWANVTSHGDYPDAQQKTNENEEGKAYADYCFGHMMKTRIEFTKDSVTVEADAPRRGYQSWCHKYPTYAELINAATRSLLKEKQTK